MPRTLADAAEKGWAVVGAAAEAGSVPVSLFKVDRPTVLVMGNEGYGLRATVKRCCTSLVQIEMAPPPSSSGSGSSSMRQQQLVDSLNVSVATGILLHQLLTTARQ
uniref:tRNA/rRNA methyltransferase SpoU type domain-containing protein n=1 Tax=Tetradesmus obliquus TaxID=3088 RepID=A0A383VRT5_TETOB|eukprot:jgi/Sobl393_1/14558/SZX68228.1